MKKRQIVILLIISTVISLVSILLTYFGIVRYLQLHVKGSEEFVEGYNSLPKASGERVVLSLAPTAEQLTKIRPTLNSILDQTVRVDQIALVVPEGHEDRVPAYVTEIANVFPAGRDYGLGTRLIPILLREKECGTTIIGLESDVVYGKDFIEFITDEAETNPGSVLVDGKHYAILVKPEYYGCDLLDQDSDGYTESWFLDQATGAKKVLYSENYRLLN